MSVENVNLAPEEEAVASNGSPPISSDEKKGWKRYLPDNRRMKVSIPKIESQVSLIFSILLKAVLFTLLFGFALLIYKGLTIDRYTLKEIEVPDNFSSGGYTGTVLAHQIQDRLDEIRDVSAELRADSLEISANEAPEMNVAVMGFGISLQSLIYYARDVMGKENKSIGGELTELDDELKFHLRMTGVPSQTFSIDLFEKKRSEALDSLMEEVSQHIMREINPQTLALYQSMKGDYEKGLGTVRYIINEKKEELDWAYWTWGYILFKQEEYPQAERKLKKATQLNSKAPHYWSSLAMVQRLQRGKLEEGYRTLKQGIVYNPDGHNLWHNLAWVYANKRMYDSAIYAIQKTISLKPDIYYYHTNLGELRMQRMNYYKQKHPDTTFVASDTLEVLKAYRKAYEMNKENSSGAMSLYSAFRFAEEEDSAAKMLDLAIELNPDNGWALRRKHIDAYYNGNYEGTIRIGKEAIRAFNVMHKDNNDQIEYKYRKQDVYNLMAMGQYQLKRYDSALVYVQKAIAIDTSSSTPYTTLAETYGFMGDKDKFYYALEKALKKGFSIDRLLAEPPYKNFVHERRFNQLQKKYQQEGVK